MGKLVRGGPRDKDATGQAPILDLDPTLVIGCIDKFKKISKNRDARLNTVFSALDQETIDEFPAIGLELGRANTGFS